MRFWTSDLHLGHSRILELCPDRPWPNLEAMNRGLIGLWNETVSPEDEVWVIGDFAMGRIRETLSLVPLLHGRKFLVPGNHDRCSPAYPHRRDRVEDWVDLYLEAGFCGIKSPGCWEIGGVLCNVNHFPYLGPEDDQYRDRFDAFRPADDGLPLVHGHVHSAWQVNGRMVNVGVDVWGYRPIPESALVEMLRMAGQDTRQRS
jgi:calcineurin-like phosphoesterase family protein